MLMLRTVLRAIAVLAMPCRRHTELISRGLDEPLPRLVRAALWLHLVLCAPCRNFARQNRFLHEAVRSLAIHPAGPGADHMPVEVRRRLAARLSRN
jgi:hypothetical protein